MKYLKLMEVLDAKVRAEAERMNVAVEDLEVIYFDFSFPGEKSLRASIGSGDPDETCDSPTDLAVTG